MKKSVSIMLSFFLIANVFQVKTSANLKFTYDSYKTRITPENNYHSMQNPPDFKWQKEDNAKSYDLEIYDDKNKDIPKYKEYNIKNNFYNFSFTFSPGTYYWRVRFKAKDNMYSDWEPKRKFLIDKDAYCFPVPPVSDMLSKVTREHPRLFFNSENLSDYRLKATTDKNLTEKVKKGLGMSMYWTFPDEPSVVDMDTCYDASNLILYPTLSYMLKPDENVGNFAKENLLKLAKWDVNGKTSFNSHDQIGRMLMLTSSIAYDWLYDLLSDVEREEVRTMIIERAKQIVFSGNQGIKSILEGDPYSSHGWTAMGFLIETGIAILYDDIYGEELLNMTLPLYINLFVPWSTEDGGWSQGAYYRHSSQNNNEIRTVLKRAGIIDLGNKAWCRNEFYNDLYFLPKDTLTLFGDEDNIKINSNTFNFATEQAIFYPSPETKWYRNQFKNLGYDYHWFAIDDRFYDESEIKKPENLENARYLKDIGWIASHSDVTAPYSDKVSLYFKSSWYGSYSHSHGDQNSFVIDAYGERMALDSGYYDSWGSNFDRGYSRRTHAHNSITHSNGVGQDTMDINAKGKITEFLTHPDFDLIGGDATDAYMGKIDRFKRNIICLKPDLFIIIDDLKAKGNEKTTFEFWLNAGEVYDDKPVTLSLFDDRSGARIEKGNSVLDLSLCYPFNIDGKYSNSFTDINRIEISPQDNDNTMPVHERAWFKTEKLNETKMVSVISTYKKGENGKFVRKEQRDDLLKLSLSDGTNCYVNLLENNEIKVDGYTFKADALVEKGNSIMLVNGTKLQAFNKDIITSDKKVSCVIGKNRIGISSVFDDAKILINYPGITKISEVKDKIKREVPKDINNNTGIYYTKENNSIIEINVIPGTYTLYLN